MMYTETQFEILIKKLKDPNVVLKAAKKLGESRDPRIINPLIDILKKHTLKDQLYEQLAEVTLEALLKTNDDAIYPAIIDIRLCVRGVWSDFYKSCLRALEQSPEKSANAIIQFLDKYGTGADDYGNLVKILGKSKSPNAVPTLVGLIRKDQTYLYPVNPVVVEALGNIHDDSALKAILTILPYNVKSIGKDLDVFSSAMREYGEMAIDALILDLQKNSGKDFTAALLGKLGSPRAVPILLDAALKQNKYAVSAIGELAGDLSETVLIEIIRKMNDLGNIQYPRVDYKAAVLLLKRNNLSGMQVLLGDSNSADHEDIRYAIEFLVKSNDPRALSTVIKSMKSFVEHRYDRDGDAYYKWYLGWDAIRNWIVEHGQQSIPHLIYVLTSNVDLNPNLSNEVKHQVRQIVLRIYDQSNNKQSLLEFLISEVKRTSSEMSSQLDLILKEISHKDAEARRKEIFKIPKDIKNISQIIIGLKDENAQVRLSAIQVLEGIKDTQIVPTAISALQDNSLEVKKCAIHILGRQRDQRAVAPLVAALKSDQKEIRIGVVNALMNITSFETIAVPVAMLIKNDVEEVKIEIIRTVAAKRHPASFEHVFQAAFTDPSPNVRKRAFSLLSQYGKQAVPPLIEKLASSRNDGLKLEIVKVLSEIRDVRAASALMPLLMSEQVKEGVRLAALGALLHIQDCVSISLLISLLKNSKLDKSKLSDAIIQLGDVSVIDAILPMAYSDSSELRHAVAVVIGGLGNETYTQTLEILLYDQIVTVREQAAIAIGKTAGARTKELLSIAANDKADSVRRIAQQYLSIPN